MSIEAPHLPARQDDRSEPSLASLLAGIISDVESLMSQQLELIRREVREDVRQATRAMTLVAIGATVVVLAGVALTFAAVHGLHEAYELSFPACFAIVGGSLAVIGGALLYGGVQLFTAIDPLPNRSIEALEENVSCILKTTPKT